MWEKLRARTVGVRCFGQKKNENLEVLGVKT
jgi:hypothetical protein